MGSFFLINESAGKKWNDTVISKFSARRVSKPQSIVYPFQH
jgi:hypothetical protein